MIRSIFLLFLQFFSLSRRCNWFGKQLQSHRISTSSHAQRQMLKYNPLQRLAYTLFHRHRPLSSSSSSPLNVTSSCVQRLKHLCHQRGNQVVLRVIVDGGGCSGFQYNFELENWDAPPTLQTLRNQDDVLIEKDGTAVIVDNLSLAYISGAKVDYIEELISSSFRITDNPNSESSCGCGVSFSPKT